MNAATDGSAAEGEEEIGEERFLAIVSEMTSADASLSGVGAAILAAHRLGIAKDTRTFARIFDIEHALVLREATSLAGTGFLVILARNARTQRTEYTPADKAMPLLARALPST